MLKKLLIISGLCLGFCLPTYATESLDKIVAVVNDEVLTESTLQEQVNLIKQQIANKAQMPSDQEITKQVLQRLIDVSLQVQIAKENNIEVTDAELDDAIKNIAKKNHFTLEQLKQNLQKEGIDFTSYRDNIRKEMMINQVQRKAVAEKITITPDEVSSFLKSNQSTEQQSTQFHVKDILVAVSDEPSSDELSKARQKSEQLVEQLKKGRDFSNAAIAESNNSVALTGGDLGWRAIYEYPPVFAQQLKTMKVGDVAGPIKTANGYHIIKLVEKRGDNQKHLATQTHVRHILLKKDALTTDDEVKDKLLKIRKLIVRGGDFAAIAQKASQDPGSAAKGGDLGWVDAGKLVPQFESAMNKLPENQVSQPVHTTYGWHLIEVVGRRKVDATQRLERAKAQEILFQQKFQVQLQSWLQALRAQSYVKVMDNA